MKSQEIYKEACSVFPGGVNSPVRAFKGRGISPLIIEKGEGDLLFDVDGKSYIDYCCSFGALILGHSHPRIVQAVKKQAHLGFTFGLTTPLEKDHAKKIIEGIPFVEKIRFVSSGTEAVMSAVRLARAFTGRKTLVKFNGNYHGHSDTFLMKAGSALFGLPSSPGVLESAVKDTISLPYNDIEASLPFLTQEVAAVILEPIAGNMGVVPAKENFLHFLRKKTKEVGALLISDEVITGFRVQKGSALKSFGIQPDLICLGKIIGGGLPAAAFGGKAEIMDLLAPLGSVFQAGTLSGNPLAMRAGLETLLTLEEEDVYSKLEEKMDFFAGPIEAFIQENGLAHTFCRRGSMFSLFLHCKKVESEEDLHSLELEEFNKFFIYLLERGIYYPPSPYETAFITLAHTEEHLKTTRDVIIDFLKL